MIQSKATIRILLATAFLLSLPLVAMQFSTEVVWTLSDFIGAAILLLGAGFMFEIVANKGANTAYRAAVGIAVATSLVLIWMNLAVGIIGSEDNPANAMYFGVVLVGVVGAAVARLEPRGMALALFVAALAQALVPVIALMIWKSSPPPDAEGWGPAGLAGLFMLNGVFVLLYGGSGMLFRRAAAQSEPSGEARGA